MKKFKISLMLIFFAISASIVLGVADAKSIAVCGKESPGNVRCFSHVTTDSNGKVITAPGPFAYSPSNFLSAYNLPGKTNTNKIIAIVDAFDDPNIVSDLNKYTSTFGLPAIGNCPVSQGTVNSPCFQKVDQNGGTNYPPFDQGWALEISLDVEIAHAICSNCNILLVEAQNSQYGNIFTAFDTAKRMGADVISNSYGSGEFSGETSFDSHFQNLNGIAITYSSGDGGFGPTYPAASPFVTSVGGTTLKLSPRFESVWNGAGSGCSAFENKPSFQKDTGCSRRTIADVSADADPATGASIFDSTFGGWIQVGGTSLSAPLIGGVYATAGGFSGPGNAVPYAKIVYGTNIYDVTTGNNGVCSPSYLCTGGPKYDGPSGLGSPIGVGAFGGTVQKKCPAGFPNC